MRLQRHSSRAFWIIRFIAENLLMADGKMRKSPANAMLTISSSRIPICCMMVFMKRLCQKKSGTLHTTGGKREKTYSPEHEHLLSGILCCPICGAGMYGNVNRKKKKDGSRYKDYFYYTCKHRRSVDGHVCTYKKQWGEDKVNAAVAEVIKKLVQNPKFEAAIRQKINPRIDKKT